MAWIVTQDVPAGRVLAENDLRLGQHSEPDKEPLADHAEGRVTQRPLRAGSPVREADLGSNVVARLGRDSLVVGLVGGRSGPIAASLRAGDSVRVVMTKAGRVDVAFGGIVLHVNEEGRALSDRVVTVAMRRRDAIVYTRLAPRRRVALLQELPVNRSADVG